MNHIKFNFRNQSGQLSLIVLVFGTVAIVILSGLIIWVDNRMRSTDRDIYKARAFDIAESGIEYYRWHLAHAHQDFQDGTGRAGPYVHDYFDKDGVKIGQFSLTIAPPAVGSTIVTITSTGTLTNNSGATKTIQAKFGISGFTKYAVVTNADASFGTGTEIFGPVHSNGGVHFDGLVHNLVTSAMADYNDPDHSGKNEFGVHTHVLPVDPLPPSPAPNRPDVFMAGRKFPVPMIDFGNITAILSQIKTLAKSSGFYRDDSKAMGYDINLKTDQTFDLYKVTKLLKPPHGCESDKGERKWGSWSIDEETFLGNYPMPTNGLIFIEDNTWVRGQIKNSRVTIAAASFPYHPNTSPDITVNNNLLYTYYDGRDVIGLIAQDDFNVGMAADDNLRIDAAIISQNGRTGRFHYPKDKCDKYYQGNSITTYGMIASNEHYGFAFTDGTGYQNRVIIYDSNLLYNPPPSFPLTSDDYEEIYWSEIN